MKRRWLGLLLTTCLLFGVSPSAIRAETVEKPPVAGTGELIINGGFEENNGTKPTAGWNDSSYWGTKAFIETPTGATYENAGTASVKITETADDAPHINHWIYDVVPGAEYQLSTWMKVSTGTSKKGAGYKVEFRTAENEASTEGTVGDEYVTDTAGAWIKKVWHFTVPYDAVNMKVYMRLYAPGTVWFDNVSLLRTSNSQYPPFNFTTDSAFYYSDDDFCNGTLTLNERMMELGGITFSETAKVRFTLADPDGNVVKTYSTGYEDGTAKWRFRTSRMDEGKDYTFSATMIDTDGVSHTAQHILRVWPRPTALDADGTYHKLTITEQEDGTYSFVQQPEAFHPVIGYHVGDITAANLAEVKKLGINVVQLALTKKANTLYERLNIVKDAGLMAIVNLYNKIDGEMKPAAYPDNIETTRTLIEKVKNHPAVFAYGVMDEPSSNLLHDERDGLLRDSYNLIRSIDPHRPVYICDFLSLADVQRYADVFCMDRYHVYDYGKNVSIVKDASYGKRPVYTLMRCHDLDNTRVNIDMLRYMFYDGLMAGAGGVGFFPYNDIEYDEENNDISINDIVGNTALHAGIVGMKTSGEQAAAFAHFLEGAAPSSGLTANGIKWSLSADKKHFVLLNTALYRRTLSIPEDLGLSWAYFKMAEPYGEDTAEAEYWHSASVQIPAQSTRVFSLDILADGSAPVFLGEDSTVLSNLPASGAVTLKCKKLNETGALYAAFYKKSGSTYELIELFEAAEAGDMLSCEIALPADRANCKLSAFYWDNEALCPIMGVRQLYCD